MALDTGTITDLVTTPILGVLVPSGWLQVLGPVALLLVGYLMYREFTGKMVTTINVLAANLFFLSQGAMPVIGIYLNVGIVFAALAPFIRKGSSQAADGFYMASWVYSSPVVAALIIWSML